jgi:hypothetical protein
MTRARVLCTSLTRTTGPRRCLLCVVPLLVMTGCELNAFLLKRVLWIPPRNALNTCRLCIWVGACSVLLLNCSGTRTCQALTPHRTGMALPAVKEYYGFVSCGMMRAKLGAFAWLSLACFALETLVCVTLGSCRRGCATKLPGVTCFRWCSSWAAACSRRPGLGACVRRGPSLSQR